MSITQQGVILQRIENALEDLNRAPKARKFLYTVDFDYGNSGTVRVLDPDTLATRRALSFDFQRRECRFRLVDSSTQIASVNYDEPAAPNAAPWVKNTPQEVVDTVVAYLTGEEH